MESLKVFLEDMGDGSKQEAIVDFLFSGETIDTRPGMIFRNSKNTFS